MYSLRRKVEFHIEGEYSLVDTNTQEILYVGYVNPLPDGTYTDTDIAPIIRQIVKPIDYSRVFGRGSIGIIGAEGYEYHITLIAENGINNELIFIWDYGYLWDMNEISDFDEIVSYGIQDYLYNGQYFPYNLQFDGLFDILSIDIIEESPDEREGGPYNSIIVDTDRSVFACVRVWIDQIPDDWEMFWCVNGRSDLKRTKRYKIRKCIPNNLMTLYFINMRGGLSWVHCEKKKVIETQITRDQITHNRPIEDTTAFGIDNYHIASHKEYTLNTDWLNDEQSMLIQDLFKSPKVWLQTYNNEVPEDVYSVIITDKKSTLKTRENDKLFNYTIKCRESNTENIFA